ncbi:unnamed protein product [Urochloa decumbens]|uniref:Uncharacterized protein n=1 Tax=Urochloa decumbens TaxID=240449 RepID=A0ABC9B949_9POAL
MKMNTPGNMARAAGLAVLLISVSAGINFFGAGGFGLVLCFMGVLAGASLVAVGVRMADADPMSVVPEVLAGARALHAFLQRNLAVVGVVVASSAVTAVSGEASPVLCFGVFALFLLGLSLINIGALGEFGWMH